MTKKGRQMEHEEHEQPEEHEEHVAPWITG